MTIAKEMRLEDEFENMGAQMVREVASKTSAEAVTARHRDRAGAGHHPPKAQMVAAA